METQNIYTYEYNIENGWMDNVSVLESSITFFITIISNCVTGHRNIILDLLLQFTNNTFLCVTKKQKITQSSIWHYLINFNSFFKIIIIL